MKCKIDDEGVSLVAECEFDKLAFERLRSRGVSEIRFEDDWNSKGPLILKHPVHPFDERS